MEIPEDVINTNNTNHSNALESLRNLYKTRGTNVDMDTAISLLKNAHRGCSVYQFRISKNDVLVTIKKYKSIKNRFGLFFNNEHDERFPTFHFLVDDFLTY